MIFGLELRQLFVREVLDLQPPHPPHTLLLDFALGDNIFWPGLASHAAIRLGSFAKLILSCLRDRRHGLLFFRLVLCNPGDFLRGVRVAVLQAFLLVTDPNASPLALEDIVRWRLPFKLCDRCSLQRTLVTLESALHEALLVEPHLLEIAYVVVFLGDVLIGQQLISLATNFPANGQLLLEELYSHLVHAHKPVASAYLLTHHHRRVSETPKVAEIFQGLVGPNGSVILPQLLEYQAFCLQHREQEQLTAAVGQTCPIEL